jgi:hypothetical protein
MQEPIEPDEFAKILRAYSVNKRYLNEKEYAEQMRLLLSERYGQSFLTEGILDVGKENKYGLVFANHSFPSHIREYKGFTLPTIDDVLSTVKLLHSECHERTKKKLVKVRKKIYRL